MPRDWRLRSPQEVRILTLWRLTSSLWISKAYRSPVVAIRRNRVADRCCATASANACSHCALVRGSHDTWRATCELICNSQNRSMSDDTCSRSRTGHEFIQVPEAARRISRKESYAVTESSRPGGGCGSGGNLDGNEHFERTARRFCLNGLVPCDASQDTSLSAAILTSARRRIGGCRRRISAPVPQRVFV